MRKLKYIHCDPACGWEYTVPETGLKITADTYDDLMGIIKRHYFVNNIDVPENLWILVQHSIAMKIPESLSTEVQDG